MADFDPSKLSKKELQDLLFYLEKRGTLTSDVVDDERSIRDTILDQVKQLQFQQTLKRDILRATNKIYDIQYNLRNEYDRELGTRQASLAIDKQITQIEKSNRSLNQDVVDLRKQDTEFSHELANSLEAQIEQGLRYKEILKDQQDTSEQIRKNTGVQGFQGLSELFQKMGGKASQLARPFEQAAEAAREVAQESVEGNKKIKEREQILEKIKSGELKATKKNLEGIEITNKKGQKLYGEAAKNSLKSGKAVTNVGEAMSKGQMAMKSFSAGAKALGPMLKKSLGPISIILLIKDIIDFFVKSMFEASEQGAKFEKNLKVSGDEAQKIRKRTNFISNDMSKINKDSVDFSNNMNSVLLTQKEIIQAMEEMNSSLGTSVDFTLELGEYGADLLRGQAFLTKQMGLTAKEAQVISDISLRQGKEQIEFTKEVLGTVEAQNVLNDTRIDSTLILKDIANLSADVRATIGDTAKELAKNVYQARKLGFEFSDLQSMQNNLLDFESSISKELEAELILGRDINLEKARAAALNNDLVGVGRELRKQNIDIKKLQKDNAIAAQAAAEAMGMTVQQAIEAQEKFENINALQKRIAENKKVSVALDKAGINAAQLMGMSLEDIKRVVGDISVTESELAEILGEKAFEAAKARSAQEQFNDVLAKAKEQFANLVDSGVLDALVQGLTSLVDSKAFAALTGGTREDFQRRRDVQELRRQGKATDEDVELAERTGQFSVADAMGQVAKYTSPLQFLIQSAKEFYNDSQVAELDAKIAANQPDGGMPDGGMDVEDFTIRTHPKDTLVMAGGTKLGEDSKETNQLLRTLITAVENGGNIYLDGDKVSSKVGGTMQLNSFRAGS